MAENTIEIDKQQARVTRLRKSLGVAAKQLHNLGSKRQKVWMLTLTYADLDGLFADLRASGANNAARGRPRGLSGRSGWEAARAAQTQPE